MNNNVWSGARLLGAAVLLFLVLGFVPTAQAEYFTITDFHADIKIEKDGTVDVTETIDVDFHSRRHGIYRDLPVRYVDNFGDDYETPLDVVSVTDEDGRGRETKLIRDGSTIRIRVGSADRYVHGRQVYVIRYRVQRVLLFLEDHDELYWNVTGNQWDAPIESASATVTLPGDGSPIPIQTECYTGRYGSREKSCSTDTIATAALYETSRPLDPQEGLTIVVGWPVGIVSAPSKWQKFWWWLNLRNNWPLPLPFIAFIAMFWLWLRRGRDPRVRESIAVEYSPPEVDGKVITAGEAGTLIDERADLRDVIGGMVGLGVKGFIKIEEVVEEGGRRVTDYTLTKLKDADETLSPFEARLLGVLFRFDATESSVSSLKSTFYSDVASLVKELYGQLVTKKFYASSPERTRTNFVGLGMVIGVIAAVLVLVVSTRVNPFAIGAAILTALIISWFGRIMPARTRTGAAAVSKVKGFQEFMMRADKDRIERMGSSIFYEYLPYAISLEVTDQWADAFKGMPMTAPSWYVMHSMGPGRFNHAQLVSNLSDTSSSLSSMVYKAPRGSGFSGGGGGGGFSGGGGGGGGGGSW